MPATDTPTKPTCLYSISDIMERTTLSRGAVYNLIRERRLRAVKVGARTVVRSTDFDAFVDSLEDAG